MKRKRGGQPKPKAVLRRNGVLVRLRDENMRKLQQAATDERRSISQQAELLIEDALARRSGGART
jgi:hypothetical protein